MPSHGDSRDPGLVTRLLREAAPGSPDALARVIPLVHAELRATAARLLRREASGHTLQPTELVHEAWLRLAGNAPEDVASRQHFLAIAARLMRQVEPIFFALRSPASIVARTSPSLTPIV